MGYNTSVIVMNDAVYQMKGDPEFGKNLANAISAVDSQRVHAEMNDRPFFGTDVSIGNHVNGATVIETHHADGTSVVAFGGNRGIILAHSVWPYGDDEQEEVRILRSLAEKYGFDLHRKRKRG